MKKLRNIIPMCLYILFATVLAQEHPPINIFTTKDYNAASQNWSISQSKQRYIYAANNRGLLEYNGASWQFYSTPNNSIMRSVKVIDSLIYTGCYHDFGYWKKNDYGKLQYTSISTSLNVSFLEDEEFWNIIPFKNTILFQSLDRIHVYSPGENTIKILDFKSKISKLFNVDNNLYFQDFEKGLFRIEKGQAVAVLKQKQLQDKRIINIFQNNNTLRIVTQDHGFYDIKDNNIFAWKLQNKNLLSKRSIFSSIKLRDGSYVLGTISNGIIHIDGSGKLIYKASQINGLSNNTILALYEDLDGSVWLGLDNGINCINVTSPYKVFSNKTGRLGSVYTSKMHNETLYLGTNQGLFFKTLNKPSEFQFIKGTQGQVWFLDVIEQNLFCGHNSGTFSIENNTAIKIANTPGTWLIKAINDSTLIQGNYNGLHILKKKNKKWHHQNKLKGFDTSSRYFELIDSSHLYLNHEYKGVFKLSLDNDLTKVMHVAKDTILQKSINSSLITYNNNIIYGSKDGVYIYNREEKQFEKDTLYSKLINTKTFTTARLIPDHTTHKLWSFSKEGIHYITTSKFSDKQELHHITFPVNTREDITGYENITPLTNNKYILGNKTGYTLLELNKLNIPEQNININTVAASNRKGKAQQLVNINSNKTFKNKTHNFKFTYSIPNFLKTQQPEYQYKLEGLYNNWSNWSTQGSVFFENLPYGDYTFSVRGKVDSKKTLNTASYSFSIERPWFISNIALGAYVLAVLLFSLFMHTVYKRYYKNQRERLMQKTTREFELKELENKQQLMRYKNERLREDIENKNRELGISTMSLIKKNEFLSTIKKELEEATDNANSIKKVIRIIDKNLNNNDDWNLFQEAFNNADKDFLKKIKTMHPALTSNDLRLCAYLRLNLSSKEIAPLLNISPRSVEVKRYRLRKKINLPHEASLSDYILEI